jgi:1-deoxy-D-xylulose-5-phosphate reductoisomerase
MKKIAILGSTGSIGRNALDVISMNPDKFRVVSLAGGRNIELLSKQIAVFNPLLAAVIDQDHAARLRVLLDASCRTEVLWGQDGYRMAATVREADLVLSAMVGAAGLLPTLAAIEVGKDVALANKEAMVIAGELVMAKAAAHRVRILPVDSEHSAVFQCLEGHRQNPVKRIILTASGGPFLNMSSEDMRKAKPEQALRHPNWRMGAKITIDSASMMNKGLEIIEARWLFDIPFERIDVVIHPQSIIHSMVEYEDGSVMAQLGQPDMRIPIAYALSYPERINRPGSLLDIASLGTLSFSMPDRERFPSLELACRAGKLGGIMPAVMNAANEIAVEAYLKERIGFMDIPRVVEAAMNQAAPTLSAPIIGDLLAADRDARERASDYIDEMVR